MAIGDQQHVLVVEDDASVRAILSRILSRAGFSVSLASTGEAALEYCKVERPDLILLDVGLPGMSGFEFLRKLRTREETPVVFVTGAATPNRRVEGLDVGADDYIAKPFHGPEVVARVRAVLRRSAKRSERPRESGVLSHGSVSLCLASLSAMCDGRRLSLTKTETQLLHTMLREREAVFSYDDLTAGTYGPDVHVSQKTIVSHMRRLRNKLRESGAGEIQTVRGVGYRLWETDA